MRYTSSGFNAALSGTAVGIRPRPLGGNYYWRPYMSWDFTTNVPLSAALTFKGAVFNIFNDRYESGNAVNFLDIPVPGTTFQFGLEVTF